MTSADWSYPTRMRFGAGRVDELGLACREAGIGNPLLVTDEGLRPLPAVRAAIGAIEGNGLTVGVWSGLRPNPVGSDVEEGVAAYWAGRHDGVVALGGGSALDVGKTIALMVGQDRPLWDFEDAGDNWRRADATAIAPVVAVPTTAGTGSEVGRAGVVIDETAGRKVIIFHPAMLPASVICDPELTIGLPPVLTIGTGMDALSHSIEALCSPRFHPMSHGIGLEGCRLVLEHLPRVVADPGDVHSRGRMMAAAAMGAVAFQKGLGGMHALSHPIGATFDTHHGMTNATVMPYVLAANRPYVAEVVGRLAAYVGIQGGFDGFLDHVLTLRAELGVPHTLVDLGVDPSATSRIAAAAVEDPSAAGNPQPISLELATSMFDAACAGEIMSAAR